MHQAGYCMLLFSVHCTWHYMYREAVAADGAAALCHCVPITDNKLLKNDAIVSIAKALTTHCRLLEEVELPCEKLSATLSSDNSC